MQQNPSTSAKIETPPPFRGVAPSAETPRVEKAKPGSGKPWWARVSKPKMVVGVYAALLILLSLYVPWVGHYSGPRFHMNADGAIRFTTYTTRYAEPIYGWIMAPPQDASELDGTRWAMEIALLTAVMVCALFILRPVSPPSTRTRPSGITDDELGEILRDLQSEEPGDIRNAIRTFEHKLRGTGFAKRGRLDLDDFLDCLGTDDPDESVSAGQVARALHKVLGGRGDREG